MNISIGKAKCCRGEEQVTRCKEHETYAAGFQSLLCYLLCDPRFVTMLLWSLLSNTGMISSYAF